jgi:citrate lyase subunit beta / citryl-CoA lyase
VTAPRSKLFLPANRLDRLDEALRAGADAISFDLEDAIAEAEKTAARDALAMRLRQTRLHGQVWVRVNAADSGHIVQDLLALQGTHVDVVNLPKAESPADVDFVHRWLDHLEAASGAVPGQRFAIVPTIETPRGLRLAADIAAASPRVVALQLGAGDLRRATGMASGGPGMAVLRTLINLAAAEARLPALDSTAADILDAEVFEADALAACALGLQGKSCMHAAHVAIANRVFGQRGAQ